jgi:hypothetical protein
MNRRERKLVWQNPHKPVIIACFTPNAKKFFLFLVLRTKRAEPCLSVELSWSLRPFWRKYGPDIAGWDFYKLKIRHLLYLKASAKQNQEEKVDEV